MKVWRQISKWWPKLEIKNLTLIPTKSAGKTPTESYVLTGLYSFRDPNGGFLKNPCYITEY